MTGYKKHTTSILAAFALVCSFASAAHAAEPFSATISSTEVLIPQPTNKVCPARGMLAASGTSLPLGNVEVMATDCVTSVDNNQTMQFSQGRMVMTATDGSGSVIASYQGAFIMVPPAEAPVQTIRYVMDGGTFTIIGGTGRYKKATGSGFLSGEETVSVNPATPAVGKLVATGTIIY